MPGQLSGRRAYGRRRHNWPPAAPMLWLWTPNLCPQCTTGTPIGKAVACAPGHWLHLTHAVRACARPVVTRALADRNRPPSCPPTTHTLPVLNYYTGRPCSLPCPLPQPHTQQHSRQLSRRPPVSSRKRHVPLLARHTAGQPAAPEHVGPSHLCQYPSSTNAPSINRRHSHPPPCSTLPPTSYLPTAHRTPPQPTARSHRPTSPPPLSAAPSPASPPLLPLHTRSSRTSKLLSRHPTSLPPAPCARSPAPC